MYKPILLGLFILLNLFVTPVKAQEQEIQQLILNIEKLNQLRAILNQMYKGYEIVSKGYNTIKDLSEGNFNLHKTFLDKLLEVSPVVKQYKKVIDIISLQKQLVKEYKAALTRFRNISVFNPKDLEYIEGVYSNLFSRSLKNLDELLMVVTANQLRMNDAERLAAIDKIHADMQDKLQFLRQFNAKTNLLAAQRMQEQNDVRRLRDLYGIDK